MISCFSRLKFAVLLTMAGLALSACQTTSARGTGDIQLSKEVASAFVRDYMSKPYPLAFAVSTGGQYYYWYACNGPRCANPANDIHRTIETCERKGNLPCKLFARGKSILWTKADGAPYTIDDVHAVLGTKPENRLKDRYANLSNLKLCEGALAENDTAWTDKYTQRYYVEEAVSRNMKPAFCAKLLGRDG